MSDFSARICNAVLNEVLKERRAQHAKWGEQNHIDGTGRRWNEEGCGWKATAAGIEGAAREILAAHPTYAAILGEEVGEAFAETDPARLREELVQVAAVAVAWIEAIDRRGTS